MAKKKVRKLLKAKGTRAQTALEYALVVGAISLVIMAAWNTVGVQVQQSIRGKLLTDINKNLTDGNATVPQ